MGFLRAIIELISDLFRSRRSPSDLARWLDLPESELLDWLNGRPPDPRGRDYTYTRFTVPKRRGGERTIEAPTELLKNLQRRILYRMLNPLPVHPAAMGFVRGRSIVSNARPHEAQAVVINIDLADFFPSITHERVRTVFRAHGWNRAAATILASICTHEGRLPQGAPTSPALSNLACRRLDTRLSRLVEGSPAGRMRGRHPQPGETLGRRNPGLPAGGRYTRYADDLTFSFQVFGRNKPRGKKKIGGRKDAAANAVSRTLLTQIRNIIEDEGFRIQLKKKVRIQRAHQRQTATGLVLNSKVNLPRTVRRRIRAMEHRARRGSLGAREQEQLRGWRALLEMVERQRAVEEGAATAGE